MKASKAGKELLTIAGCLSIGVVGRLLEFDAVGFIVAFSGFIGFKIDALMHRLEARDAWNAQFDTTSTSPFLSDYKRAKDNGEDPFA